MSSLSWCNMVSEFFKFRAHADKIGFYTEDLNRIEQSLWDIRPAPLTLEDIHVERESVES